HKIEVAVIVNVSQSYAPPHVLLCEISSRTRTDIDDAKSPLILQQKWLLFERCIGGVSYDMPAGNEDVFVAVPVEIQENRSPADVSCAQRGHACRLAYVLEHEIALIAIQREALALEVHHPDVGKSVSVEVTHIGSHAAIGRPHVIQARPTLETGFNKMAAPRVAVQEIRNRIVRDINVDVAIEVDVGCDHAKSFAVGSKSCADRSIAKCAVSLVDVEHMRQSFKLPWRANVSQLRTRPLAERVLSE